MKRACRLLVSVACLALVARTAYAQGGINLSWGDCGTFGSVSRNFACDTNTGSNSMFASAVSPIPLGQFVGEESVLDLVTNQVTLSPWWTIDISGCRGNPSAMTSDFNFVTGPFNCADPWGGAASGGSDYQSGNPAPNRARIRVVSALASPIAINNTSEYYLFRLTFSNAKTTGAGSCAGCTDGACIVFSQTKLVEPTGVGDVTLTNPLTRSFVLWQSGGGSVLGGCPGATPTRSTTWGAVKSLYR